VTTASADCAAYEDNHHVFAESVAFDDDENGEGSPPDDCDGFLCVGDRTIRLPGTARVSLVPGSDTFKQSIFSYSTSGWVYLNLDDDDANNGPLQGWVVTSMHAEGRFSVDSDAAWLGNGCSPSAAITSYTNAVLPPPGHAQRPTPPGAVLPGPAGDVNP
jgi:hypothetical protein